MDEKLLSISQLAKLRKMTSETLRHYDRIGLIKPNYVDPKTKYRYYSIRQYEKLGTIKELRQLGMSLDMIVSYFSERNVEKSQHILTEYSEMLLEEIQEQTKIYHTLQKKLHFLEELKSLPPMNTVIEQELPQRHILTYGETAGGSEEHAFILTKLEWHLNEIAPILASDRMGVYCDETLLQKTDQYIPAIPMVFLENNDIESPYKKTIPKGRYLSLFYHNGTLERYHESFEIIKEYISKNNLTICGNIYQIYKLDVTLTSDPMETVIELQIPVNIEE